MYDEDLTQARQALGDGRWEEARSFYARFSPQQTLEARPALLLIDLHDAKEAKDSKNAEIIAGKLSACLEEFDEFPDDFVRAFCPQVRSCLLPHNYGGKTIKKKEETHVKQWLLSVVACDIALSYCLADEINLLPEPEQNRIRMAAVALFEYALVWTQFLYTSRALYNYSDLNRWADPETYKRFKKYQDGIRQRIKTVYEVLGANFADGLISPEAIKERDSALTRGMEQFIILLLVITILFLSMAIYMVWF
ncbi:MAG: hypothetical protein K6G50_05885 [bacterium]|nr:hypothetical protein [bacterium]